MESEHLRQSPASPTPEVLALLEAFSKDLCNSIRGLRSDPEFNAKNLRSAYQQGHKDALEQAEDTARESIQALLSKLAGAGGVTISST
ncbi:hypothetical protein ACQCLI_31945 (plasmid) [Pseudomonas nitroreducens]|uniref:hypothetical protein n=1 Tax=Pseudomonas nitroreducens TaxID=46680 RepID=UPI00035D8FA6|nr:hypothetical protein [Pseudomonas nitroreducens]MBF3053144.1 hypothetical protein [Pseudomonas aeruginosa]